MTFDSRKIKYYLLVLRPFNLGIIAVTQLVMLLHAIRFDYHNLLFPECITIVFCIMFTAAAGYLINDIFDVETDSINKPHSRIVAHHFSIKQARVYYVILLALAITFGFWTGWSIGFLCLAVSLLLYYYSSDLKGTVIYGNLMVSFLAGATVFTASQGSLLKSGGYFVEYSMFAFLITMARELIKDMEDIEGDKVQEYQTLPVKYGIKPAKYLTIFFLASVVVYLIIFYSMYGNTLFLLYSILFLVVPTAVTMYLTIKAQSKKQFRTISFLLKIIMLLGIVSVWFV